MGKNIKKSFEEQIRTQFNNASIRIDLYELVVRLQEIKFNDRPPTYKNNPANRKEHLRVIAGFKKNIVRNKIVKELTGRYIKNGELNDSDFIEVCKDKIPKEELEEILNK